MYQAPTYKMEMIDVINECAERLMLLERVMKIREGDVRTTKIFGVVYAIHQFVYSAATPTREEHVEILLIDIEHGDIKSMTVADSFDFEVGHQSFAHSFLIELRQLCKEWINQ
jgi:hypothetical protein